VVNVAIDDVCLWDGPAEKKIKKNKVIAHEISYVKKGKKLNKSENNPMFLYIFFLICIIYVWLSMLDPLIYVETNQVLLKYVTESRC